MDNSNGRGLAPAAVNNKEGRPIEHYSEIYRKLDPSDIQRRCGFAFNGESFAVTFLGEPLRVAFPEFSVTPEVANNVKILLLRHLSEGRLTNFNGSFLAYRDVPWGSLYDKNFQGRCVKRLAYSFGQKIEKWVDAMKSLGATAVERLGDAAFDLSILPGLTVRYILWAGESEDDIPPAAQILFGDNVPDAFSAEDLAVIGDVTIDAMKRRI
ncbi:MAG: DUF3786 domain-containing protein [Oscillospiraceae bacterium]|jgi:hypothetical protein|nr:DUF3786 domain-containing protein [Oscillospiraceae bacterium]